MLLLFQLCNHPSLVVEDDSSSSLERSCGRRAAAKKISYAEEEKNNAAPGADGIAKFMPYEAVGGGRNAPVMPELSGKMFVLWRLMREMRKPGNGNDKIVIVSNYTQTLDLIGRMCRENNWGFCRLDGSISMKRRQKMVSTPGMIDFICLTSEIHSLTSHFNRSRFSVTNSMILQATWLHSFYQARLVDGRCFIILRLHIQIYPHIN